MIERTQIESAVRNAFEEYFQVSSDDESLISLGGDDLDDIEIIMCIEESLDTPIEDEFAMLLVKQNIKTIINMLDNHFNPHQSSQQQLNLRTTIMKKSERNYVIRGFDSQESFSNPTGKIEDKYTFQELVVPSTVNALANVVSTMYKNFPGMMTQGTDSNICTIDFTVLLSSVNKLEIKQEKSVLQSVIKSWADKCRVKNSRGFRVSAIKTPKFEYGLIYTVMSFQVVLSDNIFYSNYAYKTLTESDKINDLQLLKKELKKRCNLVTDFNYNHSELGYNV